MVHSTTILRAWVVLLVIAVAAHTTKPGGRFSTEVVKKRVSLDKRWSVSIDIWPESSDYYFVAPFQVGNSSLWLEVSTTTADLWVISGNLASNSSAKPTPYIPSPSANQLNGLTWNQTYRNEFNVSGSTVYVDHVGLGPVTLYSYPNNSVCVADTATPSLPVDRTHWDGSIGFAFSTISSVRPNNQLSFLETISGSLDQRLVGMALKHDRTGYLDFGYVNDTRHFKTLSWSHVDTTQGRWEIQIDHSFYVGTQIHSNDPWAAYIDSGASIISVPKFAYDAWIQQVPGAFETKGDFIPNVHGLIFPCNTVLPSFSILLGNYTAVIPGAALKGRPINDVHCYSGLQMADPSTPVLGAPFLETQYAVFKWDGPMLGLAPQSLL